MLTDIFKNNLLIRDGIYILYFIVWLFLTASVMIWATKRGKIKNVLKAILLFNFLFLLFSVYFFRNPIRVCVEKSFDENILVSPSDGIVVDIADINDEYYSKKIAIFLSPLDVHVNWCPDTGMVENVKYRPGKFLVAFASKSSEINERNDIELICKNGKLKVGQIAGFIARRICCWVKKGDNVLAGEKYGMIRFGSRTELFLPKNSEVFVKVGERVYGGQSAIGRWV